MLDGGLPCYNVYRTKDGISGSRALERKFCRTCATYSAPGLKDKHLVYGADAEPVKARLAAVFATRTRKGLIEALAGADCCISPVLTIDEALADEQLRARKMIVDGGEFAQFALPLKFSEFSSRSNRTRPRLASTP